MSVHHGVEVNGLEPPASTLRTSTSRHSHQALFRNLPGDGSAIPSRPLTNPPLPDQ
jgi:hypothetical protein